MDANARIAHRHWRASPTDAVLYVCAASYNALLDTCIRTNDLDRCMDVLDRMAADGVQPDDFTEAIVSRKRAMRAYMRKRLLADADGY